MSNEQEDLDAFYKQAISILEAVKEFRLNVEDHSCLKLLYDLSDEDYSELRYIGWRLRLEADKLQTLCMYSKDLTYGQPEDFYL